MCQNLVKRLDNQECLIWLSSLKKLKRLLSIHHHILLQLKIKYLNHCKICCSENEEYRECEKEVQWVFNTLGAEEGEWGMQGSKTKVMNGGE